MKIAVSLAKNVLAPLGITASSSAIDAGIPKKKKTFIWKYNINNFNEKMNDIMKIIQALEDSNILLKGVTKKIKDVTKEQKGGFLNMLLGTLVASLLGNLLSGKGLTRAGYGNPSKKGKGLTRAGYGNLSQNKMVF